MLDGREVEREEAAAARERYAGVLTVQLLVDQLGVPPYRSLRALDLSGQGLRDVLVDLRSSDFPVLEHVDLSCNLLQSVSFSCPRSGSSVTALVRYVEECGIS